MTKLQKVRRRWLRTQDPCTGYIRWQLTQPGWQRLMICFTGPGGDPLKEWKDWAKRVGKTLNTRIPGNWKTKRGIKKRKRALMSVY